MLICGADPGLDGALAFLDVETRRVLGIVDMPTAEKASGRREILLRELVLDVNRTLDGRRVGHIFIERQQAFAGAGKQGSPNRVMGAASAFALGEAYMAVKMLAACSGWPTEFPTPAAWKRSYGISKEKEEALITACRLMPEDADNFSHRRGLRNKATAIGRAEAALLALFGVNYLAGIARAA